MGDESILQEVGDQERIEQPPQLPLQIGRLSIVKLPS